MKFFAVIPAAGLSRRMGRPKLLLEIGGRTVIARLLEALTEAGITTCIVVGRRDDSGLWTEVAQHRAVPVQPEIDPPDMRTSIEHALARIRDEYRPDENDAWLLLPADHPVLDPGVIRHLIQEWPSIRGDVLIPTYRGKRGHPALFRWSVAREVADIPSGHGLNWLVRTRPDRVVELAVASDSILADLDTPEDYERLRSDKSG